MTTKNTRPQKRKPRSQQLGYVRTALIAGGLVVSVMGSRVLDWQTQVEPGAEFLPTPAMEAVALPPSLLPPKTSVMPKSLDLGGVEFTSPQMTSINVNPLPTMPALGSSGGAIGGGINVASIGVGSLDFNPIAVQAPAQVAQVAPPPSSNLQLNLAPIPQAISPPPVEIRPAPPPPVTSSNSSR